MFPELPTAIPQPDAIWSRLSAIKLFSRFLHLAFELFDLNQMLRVESSDG